jgi:hypothetical protein
MSTVVAMRIAALALVAVALVAAAPASAGSSHVVLGNKKFAPNGDGFGSFRPRDIFNGGDPSGHAFDISWQHWGSTSATGFGKNPIFKPGGGYFAQPAQIELRAYDLGHCPGSSQLAYRKLKGRVPARPGGKLGAWFSWASAKTICSLS